MLIGYARVSTDGPDQTTDLQRDALIEAGVDPRHLFEDRVSGSRGDRPALKAALDYVKSEDVLLVWKLDHLAIKALQENGEKIPYHLIPHLAPLGWEHVILTGDVNWHLLLSENIDGYLSLNIPNAETLAA